mmetsp:Transcript_52390/g.104099  ORF Transcript_52390/g.104099 Transcript_52390/m.104099 type:complete len:308 (+) Transcript_52390:1063-1986(+)
MSVYRARDLLAFEDAVLCELLALRQLLESAAERTDEALGHDQLIWDRRVADDCVLELAVDGDGQVGRDGPRGGGPDGHTQVSTVGSKRLQALGGRGHTEADVDRARRVLLGVLEFGLCQRSAARGAPVHRLSPAVDMSFEEHVAKDADLSCFILRLQCEVGLLPIAPHTVPPEGVALLRDRLFGERSGFFAQLQRRQLLALFLLHALQHLELDWEPMAVPARYVANLAALQQLVTVDDILKDLVERMANVQIAVGVRRAIMQHKHLTWIVRRKCLVDACLVPKSLQFWLAHGCHGALAEIGDRKRYG